MPTAISKPVILTSAGYYLPGYKAGGPITTLANMVERLGEEFSFRIATRDRDLGDTKRYEGIRADTASVACGRGEVHYLPPGAKGRRALYGILSAGAYDVLYLNSLYSPTYSILPLAWMRAGLIQQRPIVLAPRGELSAGARSIKRLKKNAFLKASHLTALHDRVLWQASSIYEEEDIRREFGADAEVRIAPDLTSTHSQIEATLDSAKRPGTIRLLFVARVCRMKNLHFALEALAGLNGDIELHVVGPIEEPAYWKNCLDLADSLTPAVRISYGGVVPANAVTALMRRHDFLLLPTCGENFGHVIVEAMSVGTPTIISDRTPWRNLQESGAGWDLPLENIGLFRETLARCIAMDEREHASLRRGTEQYWRNRVAGDQSVVEQNRSLFIEALSRTTVRPRPRALTA